MLGALLQELWCRGCVASCFAVLGALIQCYATLQFNINLAIQHRASLHAAYHPKRTAANTQRNVAGQQGLFVGQLGQQGPPPCVFVGKWKNTGSFSLSLRDLPRT